MCALQGRGEGMRGVTGERLERHTVCKSSAGSATLHDVSAERMHTEQHGLVTAQRLHGSAPSVSCAAGLPEHTFRFPATLQV